MKNDTELIGYETASKGLKTESLLSEYEENDTNKEMANSIDNLHGRIG